MLLHTQACKHWYKKIIYCFYALLLHWGANFKPQTTLRTWPFLGNWRLSADLNSAWLQYFYCGQGAETTCSLQSRLLRDNLFLWKDFVRYFPHIWKTLRCKLDTVQCLRPAYINFGTCLRKPALSFNTRNESTLHATASSIKVTLAKCAVFGIPRHLMPCACRHSWVGVKQITIICKWSKGKEHYCLKNTCQLWSVSFTPQYLSLI